ncbi:MAG: Uma2 family endonuclease [Bacteroidota bacterium]
MDTLVLKSIDSFTDKQFFEFCRVNDELRIERDALGNILIMEPTGLETGNLNSEVNGELRNWNREYKEGKTFDSSSGITLPDSSVRSPDSMWIAIEKWKAIPKDERKKFAHVTPDFVLEIRSESDSLKKLQEKMQTTYIKNGVRLAWLIEPQGEQVFIYRADGSVDHVSTFDQVLSGEDVLKGFTLKLSDLIDQED